MSLRTRLIRLLGGKPRPDIEFQGSIQLRHRMKGLTRYDLEEIIVQLWEDRKAGDWFAQYMVADRENYRLKRLLKSDYHAQKDLNRALHMADLETKNKRLKEEVREMQVKAEEFNRLLYATGLIVNCTGCWPGRPDKAEELTEEKVKEVERIAGRLRTWWENETYRRERAASTVPSAPPQPDDA